MQKNNGEYRNVLDLLGGSYFDIDTYPCEYKWSGWRFKELIDDLRKGFQENYTEGHTSREVAEYRRHYLGSITVNKVANTKKIVNGQQRLTSLTLLMIYLNNLQKKAGLDNNLEFLIFDDEFDTFKLSIPERNSCMEALLRQEAFDPAGKSKSVQNLYARYNDLNKLLSDQLTIEQLPLFVNWLIKKVEFNEITVYKKRVEVQSELKSKLMDIVNGKLVLLNFNEFYSYQKKFNKMHSMFCNHYIKLAGDDYFYSGGEMEVMARDALQDNFPGSNYDELMDLSYSTIHEVKTKRYVTMLAHLATELNECLLNFYGGCEEPPKERKSDTMLMMRGNIPESLHQKLLNIVNGNLTLVDDDKFFDRLQVILEMNRLISFCEKKENMPDWWYEEPYVELSSYDKLMYLSCPGEWQYEKTEFLGDLEGWARRKAEDIDDDAHLATELNECLLLHIEEVIELDRKLHSLMNK